MEEKCKHYWHYEHTVYSGDKIRRWCANCGRMESAKAINWRKTSVGPQKEFGEYPEGYPDVFIQEDGKP